MADTVTVGLLPSDASQIVVHQLTANKVYKFSVVDAFQQRFGNKYYKVLGITSFSDMVSQKIDVYEVLYSAIKTNDKDFKAEYELDLMVIKIFPIYKLKETDTDEICYFPAAMVNGVPDGDVKQYAALTMAFNLGLHDSEDIDMIASLGDSLIKKLRLEIEDSLGITEESRAAMMAEATAYAQNLEVPSEISKQGEDAITAWRNEQINAKYIELVSATNSKAGKELEILEAVQPLILTHKSRWRNKEDFEAERGVMTPAEGIMTMFDQYRTLQAENQDLKEQLAAYRNYVNSLPTT